MVDDAIRRGTAHPRALEVLAQLGRDEKLALLHQHNPAIPRLGLAAFRTGTEALHGVAWLGRGTVFPQPVGLAATWDLDLVRRVGHVVGEEVLAKHAADPDVSRNVWAPVVNPLRHPGWGRNEEGYSEDPHLTAMLATAYALGLRGPDPTRWRTVPTLKHAFGYNAEDDRCLASSCLPPRVLHEYELPAFLEPLAAGAVGAVMPSYNLVNGRPAHVQRALLELLRDAAPGPLLVVSDAAAPTNLAAAQRYFPDHVSSHAAALTAGVDSFTDNDQDASPTVARLRAALDSGLVSMADVDRAVLRLLHLRALTGELEGAPAAPGALDTPAHRTLAREAATSAVVLLANDGTLPLAPGRRVAVVGPMARRVLHDWYSGTPPYAVGIADALTESLGAPAVTVATGADRIVLRALSTGTYLLRSADGTLQAGAPTPAQGATTEVTDWGDGVATLVDSGTGLLWTAQDGGPVTATATRPGGWVVQESFLHHRHDDGSWSLQHLGSRRWLRLHPGTGALVAEAPGPDQAERFVLQVTSAGLAAVGAAARAADVVVVAVGNDPHLHGRETADRPHLRLPEPQAELVRTARSAGRPVVLVIVSSYPYVLDEAARGCEAVLWSSHGGQELGHAVADVLTGAAEPRGRLAQTWVAHDQDAGDITDYDIVSARSTYWYRTAEPLFAFGHGLSYSTVERSDVRVETADLDATGTVRIALTVRNTGARWAREVVQVYTDAPEHPLPFPHRLAAFTDVDLGPGQELAVEIAFPVSRLAVWDVRSGAFTVLSGPYRAHVGTSALDAHAVLRLNIEGVALTPRDLTAGFEASDFDEQDGLELSDRSRQDGDCVQVRSGRQRGSAVFRQVDLGTMEQMALEVARRGSGTARVRLRWRPSDDPATPWLNIGTRQVPADGDRYAWSSTEVHLPAGVDRSPTRTVDLGLVVEGSARVARIGGGRRPAAPHSQDDEL